MLSEVPEATQLHPEVPEVTHLRPEVLLQAVTQLHPGAAAATQAAHRWAVQDIQPAATADHHPEQHVEAAVEDDSLSPFQIIVC